MNLKWLNPKNWIPKRSYGVFVNVIMDGHFGTITEVPHLESEPHYRPCLHIPDLKFEDAGELRKWKIDWHTIPLSYRDALENRERFLRLSWRELGKWLEAK